MVCSLVVPPIGGGLRGRLTWRDGSLPRLPLLPAQRRRGTRGDGVAACADHRSRFRGTDFTLHRLLQRKPAEDTPERSFSWASCGTPQLNREAACALSVNRMGTAMSLFENGARCRGPSAAPEAKPGTLEARALLRLIEDDTAALQGRQTDIEPHLAPVCAARVMRPESNGLRGAGGLQRCARRLRLSVQRSSLPSSQAE